tara:strand:- start:151 stop:777 length:627 start_codon:yes stop_codon:yes gene_type:complete
MLNFFARSGSSMKTKANKSIKLTIPFLLTALIAGVGCRAPQPPGQAQKFEPVIGWQNQVTSEFESLYRSPLHDAIDVGDIKNIKALIDAQAELNSKNRFGATALHLATANGNLTAVQLLLRAGASPNLVNFAKQTALHFAALNGNETIAHELIKAGAEVNPVDDEDWTPLDCALWKGKGIIYTKLNAKRKVAELLLKHGGKEGEKHDH